MPAPYTIPLLGKTGSESIPTGAWSDLADGWENTIARQGVSPQNGSLQYCGDFTAPPGGVRDYTAAYQDVDISGTPDAVGELDDDSLMFEISWWQANSFPDDRGSCFIQPMDASNNFIGGVLSLEESRVEMTPVDTYSQRSFTAPVPPGTRKIRFFMLAQLIGGSLANACVDTIETRLLANTYDVPSKIARVVFRDTVNSPAAPSGVNEFIATHNGSTTLSLNLIGGSAAGWDIDKVAGSSFNNLYDTGAQGYIPGVDAQYVGRAYLSGTTVTLRISGLNDSYTYDILVSGTSETTSGADGSTITIGATAKSFDHCYNTDNHATITGVSPTSGNVDVAFSSTATHGYFSSMEIREYTGSTPPAPSGGRRLLFTT